MKTIYCIALLLASLCCSAQEVKKDFPQDLATSKIVFLEYEPLTVTDDMHKIIRKDYTARNEVFEKNNKQLEEEVKNYPFEYKVSKRSEYKALAEQGYKYVLECDLMESYNNGLQMPYASNTKYSSPVFLRDIATGDRYELFTISTQTLPRYGYILASFNRKVKREFNKE